MFLEQVYSRKNQWYLYILSLIIIFVAVQLGSIPLALYALIKDPSIQAHGNIAALTGTNTGLALTLVAFVVGFFSIFLCVRYIHGKQCLDFVTSRKKIDWGRIFFSAGVWSILTLLVFAVQFLLTDGQDIRFQFNPEYFIPLVIIALLLFPFQTSFEELLFRGYLMQWTAYLFKYRWVALLVTGVLFGTMHSANPEVEEFGMWIAMPQYILMGLILGYVAIADEGVELALGLHMANNIIAAVTFTSDSSTLQTHALFKDLNPSSSYMDIIMMLVCGLVFIYFCNRKYHFWGKVNLFGKIDEPKDIQPLSSEQQ